MQFRIGTFKFTILIIVLLAIGVAGSSFLFLVAGINFLPGNLFTITVPTISQTAKGQVIGAAVTFLGGIGALCTFLYNYNQKERTFRHQQQVEHQNAKRERDLAEHQRLESDFFNHIQGITSEDSLARANAILGLSEIACRPDPSYIQIGKSIPDPDQLHYNELTIPCKQIGDIQIPSPKWPDDAMTHKSERHYPYFGRAVARLVAALLHQDDLVTRSLIYNSLCKLIRWASHPRSDEPLLTMLVTELADANKLAWQRTKASYVMWSMLNLDEKSFPAPYVRSLCFKNASHKQTSIRRTELFNQFISELYSYARQSGSIEASMSLLPAGPVDKDQVHQRMVLNFAVLWATRDLLALALRLIDSPPEFRKSRHFVTPEILRNAVNNRRPIDLSGVQLAMADLSGGNFQAFRLVDSSLFGVIAEGARFQHAELSNNDLRSCILTNSNFFGANIRNCRFNNAKLTSAEFSCTSVFRSQFIGCRGSNCKFNLAQVDSSDFTNGKLVSPKFNTAKLTSVTFTKCRIFSADFEGASVVQCLFAGAMVGGSSLDKASKLASSKWYLANFRIPKRLRTEDSGEYPFDSRLWLALDKKDPFQEGESKRIPPWEEPGAPPD